jgi:hypothetical protein
MMSPIVNGRVITDEKETVLRTGNSQNQELGYARLPDTGRRDEANQWKSQPCNWHVSSYRMAGSNYETPKQNIESVI